MARPRTPSNILELRGAYKLNAGRRRLNEPKPLFSIGSYTDGPTELPAIWDEIVSQVAPGVLTIGDRIAMEMVCRLMAEIRKTPEELSVGKVTALCNLLGRFGLTPSDRSKVSMPEKKGPDEWHGF